MLDDTCWMTHHYVWEAVGYTWAWAQLVNTPVMPIFETPATPVGTFRNLGQLLAVFCFCGYFGGHLLEFADNLVTNSGIFYV